MKHFWTTAAVAALCAIATGAWAGPGGDADGAATGGRLLHLVASTTLRGDQPATTKHKARSKRAKAGASKRGAKGKGASRHAKGRRGRHRAEPEATTRAGRRHHGSVRGDIRNLASAPIKVGKHDTLNSIARKTGVSVEELARLNGLKKPYHVRLGARIKLPARRYYVVKSGETLYSLARRFGVDAAELAAANGIGAGKHLLSGQKLYLPGDANEPAAPEEPTPERAGRPSSRLPPAQPYQPVPSQPYTPPASDQPQAAQPGAAIPTAPPSSSQGFDVQPQPARPGAQPGAQSGGRSIIQTNPPPSSADVAAAGKGKFVWPATGQLMSGFGSKPDGQRNDGVNISASVGDPVRAAADGEVVYAGDQVPSFGNLVLVKHPGGWVTAYAHMSKIRYAPSAKDKAVPVDPMLVLPAR